MTICSFFSFASVFANEFDAPKEIRTPLDAFQEARGHIQGICCDEEAIFVVFANYIYKLDWNGNVLEKTQAVSHSGDPCIAKGKLYVSMSSEDRFGVYEYDLNLNLLRKIKLENVPACDGIAYLNGCFYIGGPSPQDPHSVNPLNVYDEDFQLIAHYDVDFGTKTNYGPQSIASCRNVLLVAYYAIVDPKKPARSAIINRQGEVVGTSALDGSTGWYAAPESMQPDPKSFTRLLVAKQVPKKSWQTQARFRWYDFDGKTIKDVTAKEPE